MPDPNPMQIPTYHVWEIEKKAAEFHAKHAKLCGNPVRIPVNIELIVEKGGDFANLLPVNNLKQEHDTYGCLVRDAGSGKMIVAVDEYMAENNETTYRFTLAEEVAHFILHGEIFREATSIQSWTALCSAITPRLYWQMDRNAKYLAGALLMPQEPLNRHVREAYQKHFCQSEIMNEKHLRALIAKRLAPLYNVSDEHAMFYRLSNQAISEMKLIVAEHKFFLEPESD